MAVSKLSRAFIDEQTTIGDFGSPVTRSVPLHDSQIHDEFWDVVGKARDTYDWQLYCSEYWLHHAGGGPRDNHVNLQADGWYTESTLSCRETPDGQSSL
jgi:hypothetical protein